MEQQALQSGNQVATTGRRFANLVIDTILYEIGMFVLITTLARLSFGNSFFTNYWRGYFFALLMLFLYYFVFEAAFQRTPGKFITGTKVIMADGSKPDIGAIAKRTLIRFVPFEAFSMDTGKVPENKGTWWHDRWASIRVVRK